MIYDFILRLHDSLILHHKPRLIKDSPIFQYLENVPNLTERITASF